MHILDMDWEGGQNSRCYAVLELIMWVGLYKAKGTVASPAVESLFEGSLCDRYDPHHQRQSQPRLVLFSPSFSLYVSVFVKPFILHEND